MQFNTGDRVVVIGSSGSGKSHFISQILKHPERYINGVISGIRYCSSNKDYIPQQINTKLEVKKSEGLDLDDLQNGTVIVLDDLMQASNKKDLSNLFIADARHKNITSFFVLHNLFPKSHEARTITLNATHFIIFRNLRDRLSFSQFARQLTPHWRELQNIYDSLSENPFTPLVIDLRQTTISPLRFKSDILNPEHFSIYCTKDDVENHASSVFGIGGEQAFVINIGG